MKIVLDNNIFFSLMNPRSIASYLFSLIKAEFFAPDFIKSEFERYKEICLSKSKLSEHEFEIKKAEIEEFIKFVEVANYKEFLKKAKDLLTDPDDVDFLALALSIDASIWSNDKHFKKQPLIKVFTTSELINKLLNKEI